jgi:hypothetical protein
MTGGREYVFAEGVFGSCGQHKLQGKQKHITYDLVSSPWLNISH